MAITITPACVPLDTTIGYQPEVSLGSQDWCVSLDDMLGEEPLNPTTEDGTWWVSSSPGSGVFVLTPLCSQDFLGRLEFRLPVGYAGDALSLMVSTTWRYFLDMSGGGEIIVRVSPPSGNPGGVAFLFLSPLSPSGSTTSGIVEVLWHRDDDLFGIVTDETPGGQYVDPNTDPYTPDGDDAWARLVFEDAEGGGDNHVTLYTSSSCGEWTERFDADVAGDINRLEIALMMQAAAGVADFGAGFFSEIIIVPGTPPE